MFVIVMTMFLTGNLDIFPQYRWNDPDTENYYETYYDVTDKNKKVSFEAVRNIVITITR
jgi:hypothetical protein